MERISSLFAWRWPSRTRVVLAALTVAVLVATVFPAVSAASETSRGDDGVVLMRGSGYTQRTGSKAVRALQRQLRQAGFTPGPVDGLFGARTEAALRRFQAAAGVEPDGVLGPRTGRALKRERAAQGQSGDQSASRVAPLPTQARPARMSWSRTGDLSRGPVVARGSGYVGAEGSSLVRSLQRRLRHLGFGPGPVDGLFGPRTESAVGRFQAGAGLAADGVVGPATYKALRTARPSAPTLVLGAGMTSRDGSRAVGRLQRALRRLGFDPGPSNGGFGRRTRDAVERFQRAVDLPVDGVAGPMTIGALLARAAPSPRPAERTRAAAPGGGREAGRAKVTPVAQATREAGPRSGDGLSDLRDHLAVLLLAAAAALAALLVVATRTHRLGRKPIGRAIGYVSVAPSDRLESAPVLEQVGAIEGLCSARHVELVEVVHDVGRLRGSPLERPGLRYALDQIEAGEVTHIAVPEPTILGRSERQVARVLREVHERGGSIYAGSPSGRFRATPGSPARRLIVNQPASPTAAQEARQMIDWMTPNVSKSKRHDLMLLATEVVNNAVVHASQRGEANGDIRVEIAVSDARMHLAVRDRGAGFEIPAPPEPASDERVGGWGLYIVDAIADEWGIDRDPTTVWLEVALS